jgi:hypothetical protein
VAKLILKSDAIKIFQVVHLVSGTILLLLFLSSVNTLPQAKFEHTGQFYQFMLFLSVSTPAIFVFLTTVGLFLFTGRGLLLAFISSVVSGIWYFALSILLIYVRFTFLGKCGFEGYIERIPSRDPCFGQPLTMLSVTIFIATCALLFALLWVTIVLIIRAREENKQLEKQLPARRLG